MPLSLRPPRLLLVWAVPSAALAIGLDGYAASLSYTAFLLLVSMLRLAVLPLRGRTEANVEGLRNRLIARTTEIDWADVDEFVVVPSLFGRYVRVTRENGRPVSLAAPREGLFARDAGMDASLERMRALAGNLPPVRHISTRRLRAFLVLLLVLGVILSAALGAPWLDPWWPTRHEATRLPRACDLVDVATRDRLTPGWAPPREYRDDVDYSAESDCTVKGAEAELDVRTALERRNGLAGGTRIAADRFTVVEGSRAVVGLGDEASRTTSAFHGTNRVYLLVRRHNVLVEVDYTAGRPIAEMAADSDALARTVLGRIPES